MDHSRLRQLAGIISEDAGKFPIGLFFKILDKSNMQKAVDALLAAGFSIDLKYSMGDYLFNFKNEDVAEEAHKIVSKVIDKSKEAKINAES